MTPLPPDLSKIPRRRRILDRRGRTADTPFFYVDVPESPEHAGSIDVLTGVAARFGLDVQIMIRPLGHGHTDVLVRLETFDRRQSIEATARRPEFASDSIALLTENVIRTALKSAKARWGWE